jgi:hypothetical protein
MDLADIQKYRYMNQIEIYIFVLFIFRRVLRVSIWNHILNVGNHVLGEADIVLSEIDWSKENASDYTFTYQNS